MARKRVEEEAENHDRWLISYADFITLLFAFFVVMYAISVVNVGKYRVLSDALGDAFGGKPTTPQASSTIEQLPLTQLIARKRLEAMRREQERLNTLARQLNASLAPLVKDGKVRVTQTARGVKVDINASVLFAEGQAVLGKDARATLGTVAGLLQLDTHAIQVEGHTDDRPIANSAFPSNWELSSVRASSVVRLFIEGGIDPSRLTAVGHGANLPVAPNTDEAGRARNRRVAVTILAATPQEGG
ncbi:flagellar motor protein MotD [Massilia sp. Dwa41.01b]|uniref:flagellar motor protein MotD n=1 Tax=unclassified Massilia TaxID=2609279 RepID=UPI0015FFF77D|nr:MULTISPECIES: flagellar motor protein MotD [unclassified Massilia]QNA90102.1 flagellar motor protein MotD [Massilia sp. Dwa41.01b]QNB00992.1 flagellar motor protein MotD [Massilia sp. Se16.2.3]